HHVSRPQPAQRAALHIEQMECAAVGGKSEKLSDLHFPPAVTAHHDFLPIFHAEIEGVVFAEILDDVDRAAKHFGAVRTFLDVLCAQAEHRIGADLRVAAIDSDAHPRSVADRDD